MDNVLSDAINQVLQNWRTNTQTQNQAVQDALQRGDYQAVLANAAQGVAPMVGTTGPASAVAAARNQLAPYQQPVFDRILQATANPQLALEKAKELTNLMSTRASSVLDIAKSMLSAK